MKALPVLLSLALAGCYSTPGPVVPKTQVERKMIGLLEKFDRWDINGDGQLESSELREAETLSGYEAQAIVDFYDLNKNGKISLREAQTGFSRVDEAEKIEKSS